MFLCRSGIAVANCTRLTRPRCVLVLGRRGIASALTSDEKPYYITTPIFYPNAAPHIGHLHSIVIADILARYARLARPNRPVYFMTGTDEHGLKIQKAASGRGLEPLAFCDEVSQKFRALAAKANASNTIFSRTTERQHCDAVKHLWRELDAKGLIYKGSHEGWYSISDECFYTDKQITRVPSEPGSEPQYVSTESGSKVEWTQEENYKFRLSSLREPLLAHFQSHPDAIFPPQHHADIVAALSGPIDDLSVSRPSSRLSWGIPVPNDPEHTIYVWIDALTIYLSASGYPWASSGGSGAAKGWPPNVQIIGKDILRFHAVYFPAMLQALGLPLTQRLLTHAHWTVDQRKMSKSLGNVADPIEALDEFGTDVVRYYLARVGGRFKDDVDWSRPQLEKHAREISSALGNLLSRITGSKIQNRAYEHGLPSITTLCNKAGSRSDVKAHLTLLSTLSDNVARKMDGLLVADALDDVVHVLDKSNLLMTRTEAWSAKTPAETVAAVYVTVVETLRICGILLQPFMPEKAETLLDTLETKPEERTLAHAGLGKAETGKVRPRVLLFAPRAKRAE